MGVSEKNRSLKALAFYRSVVSITRRGFELRSLACSADYDEEAVLAAARESQVR